MTFSSFKIPVRSVECPGFHSLWLIKGGAPLKANSHEAHSGTIPAGTILIFPWIWGSQKLPECWILLPCSWRTPGGQLWVGSHSEKHARGLCLSLSLFSWPMSVPQVPCSLLEWVHCKAGAGNWDWMQWWLLNAVIYNLFPHLLGGPAFWEARLSSVSDSPQ